MCPPHRIRFSVSNWFNHIFLTAFLFFFNSISFFPNVLCGHSSFSSVVAKRTENLRTAHLHWKCSRSRVMWTKRYSYSNVENILKRPTTWMVMVVLLLVLLVYWCDGNSYAAWPPCANIVNTCSVYTSACEIRQICRWIESCTWNNER